MTDTPTIYAALAAVMAEVQSVAKKDRNTHQNFQFRGIDAVMNAVGPALRTHGVIVVPQLRSADYAEVHTSTGKPATACRVTVSYVFYSADGSSIESSVAGEAWDSGDKACPKAMSVAFRTALLQALCLPTDEPDPDSHTYERASSTEPVPVDMSKVEAAIIAGQDVDLAIDWDKTREYASRSQANADKVVADLRAKIDEAGKP